MVDPTLTSVLGFHRSRGAALDALRAFARDHADELQRDGFVGVLVTAGSGPTAKLLGRRRRFLSRAWVREVELLSELTTPPLPEGRAEVVALYAEGAAVVVVAGPTCWWAERRAAGIGSWQRRGSDPLDFLPALGG
ncbi:MAG: hypothetical protein J0L92_03715 [Deltaproteobacteria bacterium]|nr:hypothetical protein [Deltaproteobacteria bacterium]